MKGQKGPKRSQEIVQIADDYPLQNSIPDNYQIHYEGNRASQAGAYIREGGNLENGQKPSSKEMPIEVSR